jgi:hypothetical protein
MTLACTPLPEPYIERTTQPFGVNGHPGIDKSAPVGTPYYASNDHRVVTGDEPGGAGYWYNGFCDDGMVDAEFHLSAFVVRAGRVTAGTLVAFTGGMPGAPGAGNTTGPHAHIERRLPNGTRINPEPEIQEAIRAGRLPGRGGTPQPTPEQPGDDSMSAQDVADLKNTLGEWMQQQTAVVVNHLDMSILKVGVNIVNLVNSHTSEQLDMTEEEIVAKLREGLPAKIDIPAFGQEATSQEHTEPETIGEANAGVEADASLPQKTPDAPAEG